MVAPARNRVDVSIGMHGSIVPPSSVDLVAVVTELNFVPALDESSDGFVTIMSAPAVL